MATSMHYANGLSVGFGNLDGALIRQPGFFDDGQGIHVAPNQYRGSLAVLQYSHDAVSADAGCYLESLGAQAVGNLAGGALFLQRQLRMSMEVRIEREPAIEFACDFLPDKWCQIASVRCGNFGFTARKIRDREYQ